MYYNSSLMHDHHHHHEGSKRSLLTTLVLTVFIMGLEIVGGLWSGSLALLADSGHMFTDILALLIAWVAQVLSDKPADDRRTFGYRRLEILAALLNGIALIVLSFGIIFEAAQRWKNPQPIHLPTMLIIAAIGLVANVVGMWLLHKHRTNINTRSAFLHIAADALNSIAVLIGGGIIALTHWTGIDPLLSIFIALTIVVTSVRLLREVIDVLLESAPRGIDTEQVRKTIGEISGVTQVHDLHVWSITNGVPALSAHIIVKDPHTSPDILLAVRDRLRHRWSIDHATLQIENESSPDCGGC